MKKVLFAFAAGMLLLTSCNQTKDSTSGTNHAVIAKQNSENFKAINHAIETGDMGKLDSVMSKDAVDHEGNMGKDIVGLDSLKHYLGGMHNYVDGLKFDVISDGTSEDNNYYFAMVRMTGKSKANPWGMPVGKNLDYTSMDVVKVKDGKATDHWSFESQKDIGEMMAAMQGGHMKPMMKDSTAK